jgi:hypothetical protein
MGRGEWLPAFQIIRVVFESLIRLEVLQREYLRFDKTKRVEALKVLKRMNVTSTVLFPGLDGFARSLGEGASFLR